MINCPIYCYSSMRELRIVIRIDEKKNIIGSIVDPKGLGIPKGIDRSFFLIGIYNYLINKELGKLR